MMLPQNMFLLVNESSYYGINTKPNLIDDYISVKPLLKGSFGTILYLSFELMKLGLLNILCSAGDVNCYFSFLMT
jgi:hypothetical protein